MLGEKNHVVRVLRPRSAILSIFEHFIAFSEMQTEQPLLVDVNTLGAWVSFVFFFKEMSRQLVYVSSSSRSEVWGRLSSNQEKEFSTWAAHGS